MNSADGNRPAQGVSEPPEGMVPYRRDYMMSLILLAYMINGIDRGILTVMIEPLKKEFSLSDSELGLISGLAYGASYAVSVIPLGILVDRYSRRNLLALLLSIWSGMTFLSGFASTFSQLLWMRVAVGASEAGASPASNSLISDLYNPSRRMAMFGLFFAATTVGASIAAAGGSWVAQAHGWRAGFWIAGAPGLFVALLMFITTREPRRGGTDGVVLRPMARALPFRETIRFCVRQLSLLHVYVGAAAGGIATSILAVWTMPFLIRSHGLSLVESGLLYAIMAASSLTIGAIAGGYIVDQLNRRRPETGLIFIGGTNLAAVPIACIGFLVENVWTALVALWVAKLLVTTYMAVGTGTIVNVTEPRMRGRAIAFGAFLNNLVGYGVGPLVVGIISTAIGGNESLRYALVVTMGVSILLTSINFAAAARTISRDIKRVEEYEMSPPP